MSTTHVIETPVGGSSLHYTWLWMLWVIQYSIFAMHWSLYAVWAATVAMARFVFKFGIVVLLVSIIGWLLIPLWLIGKFLGLGNNDRAARNWPKPGKPWLISLVRGE